MRTGVALLAAASLLLGACSSGESQDSASETTAEQAVAHVQLASGSMTVGNPPEEIPPPFHGAPPEQTPTSTAEPASAFGMTDVQVQDGAAVFSFAGDGVVNYVASYVDKAVTSGSGATVDVQGTSILQVDLISSPSAQSLPHETALPDQLGSIVSVNTTDPSDGVTQAFIGTSSERPDFTVSVQQDPPAVVVRVL